MSIFSSVTIKRYCRTPFDRCGQTSKIEQPLGERASDPMALVLQSLHRSYMEASKPVEDPTAAEMELPHIEQALLLAGMAKERSRLCLPEEVAGTTVGATLAAEMTGLLSLASAWEGATLAMMAARGEILIACHRS